MAQKSASFHAIEDALQQRILIIDGAMGTMIQEYKFEVNFPRIKNI